MAASAAVWGAADGCDDASGAGGGGGGATRARAGVRPVDAPDSETMGEALHCSSGACPLAHARWSAGRVVSAVRWVRSTPNVLLASYARAHSARSPAAGAPVEADGVVAAWDVERGQVQRALVHTAPLTALVAPHALSPTQVVAGTLHGELAMWDTRARTASPTLRAPAETMSPVRALQAADASSPFLVSASGDGTVSAWALARLSAPVDSTVARERGLRDLRVSGMSIPSSAAFHHTPGTDALGKRAAVMLSGEDGGVYRVDNAERQWAVHHAAARHDGPVTAVACHPGHPRFPGLGDVAATASVDGSVALWSFGRRGAGLRAARFDLGLGLAEPATDVQWAPGHPGAFAACDGAGGVSVFDVTRAGRGARVGRFTPPPAAAGPGGRGPGPPALNCLQWSHGGAAVAAGGVDGKIHLWRAADALCNPDGASWEVVCATVKQWRAREAARVGGAAAELPVPPSYPFTGLPPVFNPLAAP